MDLENDKQLVNLFLLKINNIAAEIAPSYQMVGKRGSVL